MYQNRPEPAPKPFAILPFEESVERKKTIGHEKFNKESYSGEAYFSLKLLSRLHIGSGLFEIKGTQVVKGFISSSGQPIIPGSSLKGAFRSTAEAISNSCVCKGGKSRLPDRNLKECSEATKLCPACRIYGAIGYSGRVYYSDGDACLNPDSMPIHNIPALFRPREDARLYKNSQGEIKGRKFYYHGQMTYGQEPIEVVSEGTILNFKMQFENLLAEELCLVLTGMGIETGFNPKIGGGKPVCLGSIEVEPNRLILREMKDAFTTYHEIEKNLDKKNGLESFLKEKIFSQRGLVKENSLARLKSIWTYPSPRKCPSGLY